MFIELKPDQIISEELCACLCIYLNMKNTVYKIRHELTVQDGVNLPQDQNSKEKTKKSILFNDTAHQLRATKNPFAQ